VQNGSGRVDHVLGVIRDLTGTKAREDDLLRKLSAVDRTGDTMTGYRAATDNPGSVTAERTTDGSEACGQRNGSGFPPCQASAESTADAKSYLLDPILAQVERNAIRAALSAANRQRNKAARLMGISRSRLYRRMEALGIDPNEHV
jgi:DNA-binding NtrC family response regulator